MTIMQEARLAGRAELNDFSAENVTKNISQTPMLREALGILLESGSVTELRIPGAQRLGVVSGYFNDLDKLTKYAARWSGDAQGIYIIPNPVNPSLLARAANRCVPHAKTTTSDGDIENRRWLLIDIDPIRPAGISSTDVEHELAISCANQIANWLKGQGWPDSISADSGNGGHLLTRIDLPNDKASTALIKQCLESLDWLFSDDKVKVDLTTFNAARIWKLYGTKACKGDNMVDRPHRLAQILELPKQLEVVELDKLKRLASMFPAAEKITPISQYQGSFDLETWITSHSLSVVNTGAWNSGRKWILNPCPFNSSHTNQSAYIVQFSNGAIAAGCHHNGCSAKGWNELRDLIEPGAKRRQSNPLDRSAIAVESESWPEPEPLVGGLLPVELFDERLLPESFRPAVKEIAELMQVPLDLPAATFVCTLGGAVGRRATIQPKAHDTTFNAIPNLYGGLITPPGFMKSPIIAACTQPLKKINAEYDQEFKVETEGYQQKLEEWELAKAAYRESRKAQIKGSKKSIPDEPGPPPDKPGHKRLIINDTTYEKLHEIMRENPSGIFLIRDELSGWWSQLDKQGREGERAFYLEAWNGDTDYTIGRISRGDIYVPACCLSILGGIQPNKLRSYLADTLSGGVTDDGLIQRFQILIWPDFSKAWKNIDRTPHHDSLNRVALVLRNLVRLQSNPPLRFKFAHDAQDLFNEFRAELEAKIRSDEIAPILSGHLSKFRSLMPSLALLFELADLAAREGFDGFVDSLQADSQKIGQVSLHHAQQGAAWCDYLESHARRIYSCIVSPQIHAAQVFAERIKAGKVGSEGSFTLREVYLKGWTGLDTPERSSMAAQVLHDAGWIRPIKDESGPQGGRPSHRYEINPKVRR
jgi:hypothetical protein